jgi:hypothetical protein
MKTVKIGTLLYCYIKDKNEFNQILDQEKPPEDSDIMAKHRKDMDVFNGTGFYIIEYIVFNPCWHGFSIEKIEKAKIGNLIKTLQTLLTQPEYRKACDVSNQIA